MYVKLSGLATRCWTWLRASESTGYDCPDEPGNRFIGMDLSDEMLALARDG